MSAINFMVGAPAKFLYESKGTITERKGEVEMVAQEYIKLKEVHPTEEGTKTIYKSYRYDMMVQA